MATPGKPIDSQTKTAIIRLRANGWSFGRISREQRVSIPTVKKVLRKP